MHMSFLLRSQKKITLTCLIMSSKKKFHLFIIIISQFLGTSLWFASNAVMPDLIQTFGFGDDALALLTSVVQFGFITGTLSFALLALADRISPTFLFLISVILAAICNFLVIYSSTQLQVLVLRFSVGFFLAGIYPVGMKIAADHFNKGLGKALGLLVGALVLGTALPHFIKSIGSSLDWQMTLTVTTLLALIGGILLFLLVPNGENRKKGGKIKLSKLHHIFKNKALKKSAFGYFGHMFELYTFWAFVPIIISLYIKHHPKLDWSIPWFSFVIIAIGSVSCALGGLISQKTGERKVAVISLLISGFCCLLSPLAFSLHPIFFTFFILIWGITVISDSPMFSTLIAQNADPQTKGTALTLVNSLGFGITILSLQVVNYFYNELNLTVFSFMILAFGPILGLLAMKDKK